MLQKFMCWLIGHKWTFKQLELTHGEWVQVSKLCDVCPDCGADLRKKP